MYPRPHLCNLGTTRPQLQLPNTKIERSSIKLISALIPT